MEIKVKAGDRNLKIQLTGELDHHAAKAVMMEMDRYIEEFLPHKTVLDMAGVSFMDSSGIAVVIRAKRKMNAAGGELLIMNLPPQPMKVLIAAGVNQYVNLV